MNLLIELDMTPEQLAVAYHDFEEYSQNCKFRGCLHDSEPYCAVKEAVTDERISQERYEDYLSFLKETKALKEKKYG